MSRQMFDKEHIQRYKDRYGLLNYSYSIPGNAKRPENGLLSIPENPVEDSDIHFVLDEFTPNFINLCTPQSVSGEGENDNPLNWQDDPFNLPEPPYQNTQQNVEENVEEREFDDAPPEDSLNDNPLNWLDDPFNSPEPPYQNTQQNVKENV